MVSMLKTFENKNLESMLTPVNNTDKELKPKRKDYPLRNWCITIFDYDLDEIDMYDKQYIKYIIMQEEECPKTNKKHLQGYVEFTKSVRFTYVKDVFGQSVHVEKRRGSQEQAINYCKKDETSTGFRYEYGRPARQGERTDLSKLLNDYMKMDTVDFIENNPESYHKYSKMLKEYKELKIMKIQKEKLIDNHKIEMLTYTQLKMIKALNDQTDREISWIYDEKGNNGKTWLSKYLVAHKNAAYYSNCKTADIALAYNYEPIVVFDFSRSLEDHVNYNIIECMKNGMLFSNKYNSKLKIFDTPKIIVMANFYPDISKLSNDRWNIITLE